MNVEYFISKKIYSTKEKNNSYTKPILRIAIFAIALSVAIMLISIMVIGGFKKNITLSNLRSWSIERTNPNVVYDSRATNLYDAF